MIERRVVLPAPPDMVWEALTQPEGLSDWFGAAASGIPAPGGRLEFRWPDGSERAATIESLEPARSFSFRWAPFVRDATGRALPSDQTRVVFTLELHPEGTLLHVLEEGLALARASGGAR